MSRSIKYSNIKFFITFSLILLGQLLFSQTLKDVIDGDHRSEKNSARDKYRHPIETLEFFGIKSTMTVVEISPGGGWYQEILAPFLNKNGQYISATYNPKSEVKRERDRYDPSTRNTHTQYTVHKTQRFSHRFLHPVHRRPIRDR